MQNILQSSHRGVVQPLRRGVLTLNDVEKISHDFVLLIDDVALKLAEVAQPLNDVLLKLDDTERVSGLIRLFRLVGRR